MLIFGGPRTSWDAGLLGLWSWRFLMDLSWVSHGFLMAFAWADRASHLAGSLAGYGLFQFFIMKSTKTIDIQWKLIDKSLKINENHWKSLKT